MKVIAPGTEAGGAPFGFALAEASRRDYATGAVKWVKVVARVMDGHE